MAVKIPRELVAFVTGVRVGDGSQGGDESGSSEDFAIGFHSRMADSISRSCASAEAPCGKSRAILAAFQTAAAVGMSPAISNSIARLAGDQWGNTESNGRTA
jgi:hypothetical protein